MTSPIFPAQFAAALLLLTLFSVAGCRKDVDAAAAPPVATTPVPVAAGSDTGLQVLAPVAVIKTNSQKVYVHFMAWFEDTLSSAKGTWGQHWTMANRDPRVIDGAGHRQIASWFYPKTGPYASRDSDIIDYQLLLMKYAGIDGLIIDWWGTSAVYDYPAVKKNTDTVVSRTAAAGLQFAICYEDQALPNVTAVRGTDTVAAAKSDFAYLQSAYFTRSNYIRNAGRPLLLGFGPQGMLSPAHWKDAFSVCAVAPAFVALQNHADAAGAAAIGEFAWVTSGGLAGLQQFYGSRAPGYAASMAGAYPGFKDYYQQGGWGNNLFTVTHTGTLQSTLNAAKASNLVALQLITWNDYGEGTMLEPTDEFGFTFLKQIQQYTGVRYTDTELALIYKWFTQRRKYRGNAAAEEKLKQAYYYLVSLQPEKAKAIIDLY